MRHFLGVPVILVVQLSLPKTSLSRNDNADG
jgi:hypothetical protein